MKKDSYSGTQAVTRAIALLKFFDDAHPECSLIELVERSGLNKTTVFRILSALEAEGLIERSEQGYRLGSEMIALGGRAMRANPLREASRPFLKKLSQETGETTTLEVLRFDTDGTVNSLVIDEILGRYLVGTTQYIGSRLALHATSTGKVLMAFQEDGMLERLLNSELSLFTDKTKINKAELMQELELVRTQGFATAQGELEPGLMTTAAPIWYSNGKIGAALAIVGPSIRLTATRLLELADKAKATASDISYALGYRS